MELDVTSFVRLCSQRFLDDSKDYVLRYLPSLVFVLESGAQLGCRAAPDSCSKRTPAAKRVIQLESTLMRADPTTSLCLNNTPEVSKCGGYKRRHATRMVAVIYEWGNMRLL